MTLEHLADAILGCNGAAVTMVSSPAAIPHEHGRKQDVVCLHVCPLVDRFTCCSCNISLNMKLEANTYRIQISSIRLQNHVTGLILSRLSADCSEVSYMIEFRFPISSQSFQSLTLNT